MSVPAVVVQVNAGVITVCLVYLGLFSKKTGMILIAYNECGIWLSISVTLISVDSPWFLRYAEFDAMKCFLHQR